MFKIQMIDITALLILVITIVASILLHRVLKKKLQDIEGDSEVYVVEEEMYYQYDINKVPDLVSNTKIK